MRGNTRHINNDARLTYDITDLPLQNQLKKRFFILKGCTLEYYRDDACQEVRRKINLNNRCTVRFFELPNSFAVTYPVQATSANSPRITELKLIAPDVTTCRAWVKAIQERIEWDTD